MQASRALERLAHHQHRIAMILREAKCLLASGGDALQIKAIALVRWELTRTLREYQLFKHTEIFDPIVSADVGTRSRAAALLKQRCLDLGEAFADHVQRWTLQSPATLWDDYQREATDFIKRIEHHLVVEQREVSVLLSGVVRTRQP